MAAELNNHRVLVTRNEPKANQFAEQISRHGGNAVVAPLIKIQCQSDVDKQQPFEHIKSYEWLVFTSANGVTCFFEALTAHGGLKQIKDAQIAVVGQGTDDALETFGFKADFMPSVYNADTLAAELIDRFTPQGPVLLIRGQLSKTTLNEALEAQSIPFNCLEVYETVANSDVKPDLERALTTTIHFITFTSPSTVDAFMELAEDPYRWTQTTIVCIGTTTQARVLEYGFEHVLVADVFTVEGMLKKMHEYISSEGS